MVDTDAPLIEQTVEEVLSRWPGTAEVFIRHKMACVGCIMAPFQTLKAAAKSYRIPEAELLSEIHAAASSQEPVPVASPTSTGPFP